MNISFNWLKEYVDLSGITLRQLADRLTMSTVEVESVKEVGASLDNVVLGQVEKIQKHPNADKLRLAVVDIGGKKIKVVCGGRNLHENMRVAVALPGAKVRWHGQSGLVVLEPAEIRGVKSEGMICSADEIGLENIFPHALGDIMDLSGVSGENGSALAQALELDDAIIEIDNKSLTNRPDLWGHYGMAREMSAIFDRKLKEYKLGVLKQEKKIKIAVKIDEPSLCLKYLAVALDSVKVGPSPEWLKKRLLSIGQKPINNLVDISNYVMFDLGQPLHIFDADKISNGKIIVRRAVDGEKIFLLDSVERRLVADDLVIADSDKAIALAGVMGAANSEVSALTKSIIIEAANFSAVGIRKTANRLALRTEAAIRFEKSLDPLLAEVALRKAVNVIIRTIPGAKAVSPIIEDGKFKADFPVINLTWDFINKKIGQRIDEKKAVEILKGLGFGAARARNGIKVKVPSWRATKDISIPEDIIEEISRVFGYGNIKAIMPPVALAAPEENNLRRLEREIKKILVYAAGANEVSNYSFLDRNWLRKLGLSEKGILLENPVAEGFDLLRASLIPNLFKNIDDNSRFFREVNLFEVGKIFEGDKEGEIARLGKNERLARQDLIAAGVVSVGSASAFSQAKGIAENIFSALNLELKCLAANELAEWCHPREGICLSVGGENVGYVASLHPRIAGKFVSAGSVAVWQINLNKLEKFYPSLKKFTALPKYPSAEFDLSLIVSANVLWGDIKAIATSMDSALVKEVNLLDVYKNGKIESGKKSLTFRVVCRADERTLEDAEKRILREKISAQLRKAVGAEIREAKN